MAVALAGSIGLHWAFLQSVAWTTMLVGDLGTFSFSEAVQRTFDGKHPCSLCRAVAQGKRSEKKPDVLDLKKFEGIAQSVAIALPSPPSFARVVPVSSDLQPLAHAPPTPPPRAA
jgi:hypothetical protein